MERKSGPEQQPDQLIADAQVKKEECCEHIVQEDSARRARESQSTKTKARNAANGLTGRRKIGTYQKSSHQRRINHQCEPSDGLDGSRERNKHALL